MTKYKKLPDGQTDPNPTRDRTFILTEPEMKLAEGVASGTVEPIDPFTWNVATAMHMDNPEHSVEEYYDILL